MNLHIYRFIFLNTMSTYFKGLKIKLNRLKIKLNHYLRLSIRAYNLFYTYDNMNVTKNKMACHKEYSFFHCSSNDYLLARMFVSLSSASGM